MKFFDKLSSATTAKRKLARETETTHHTASSGGNAATPDSSPRAPRQSDSADGSKRNKAKRPKGTKGTKGTKSTRTSNVSSSRAAGPIVSALKIEATVVLPNGEKLRLSGLKARNGVRYVLVRRGREEILTPMSAWHSSSGEASRILVEHGVSIVGSMSDLRDAVAGLRKFPRQHVITKPGWNDESFVQVSGEVIGPTSEQAPHLAFTPAAQIVAKSGTLEEWKKQVAAPLANHQLATFAMMATFGSAILRLSGREDNFGFELAGPPGRGKSTLQMLMSSAAGPAFGAPGSTYWMSCNTTINALETTLSFYNDMPLILEEAGLVSGSSSPIRRAQEMHRMIFSLSAGRQKQRLGEPQHPTQRFVFFLSTNVPIATLLGSTYAAEADALADRNITLPLLQERVYGVFDSKPDGYASTGAFADALKLAAGCHYGQAMPAFLGWLVVKRSTAPKVLNDRVTKYVDKFIEQCGIDSNNGSQRRVAEAFGLIYAAGRLAKQAGVLPSTYRCLESALAMYQLHQHHGRVPRSFEDRLRVLMRKSDVIDLSKRSITDVAKSEREYCSAFLYIGRSGARELLIPVANRHFAFADWNQLSNDLDFEQRLVRSKDRDTVKRPVGRQGEKVAVYCFNVGDIGD